MIPPQWTRAVVRLISLMIMAISLLALLGHIAGRIRWYHWMACPGDVGMAFNTAVAIGMIGACLFIMSRDEQ